jgi:hypothetical protein
MHYEKAPASEDQSWRWQPRLPGGANQFLGGSSPAEVQRLSRRAFSPTCRGWRRRNSAWRHKASKLNCLEHLQRQFLFSSGQVSPQRQSSSCPGILRKYTPVRPLPVVRGLTTFAESPPMDSLLTMYSGFLAFLSSVGYRPKSKVSDMPSPTNSPT